MFGQVTKTGWSQAEATKQFQHPQAENVNTKRLKHYLQKEGGAGVGGGGGEQEGKLHTMSR